MSLFHLEMQAVRINQSNTMPLRIRRQCEIKANHIRLISAILAYVAYYIVDARKFSPLHCSLFSSPDHSKLTNCIELRYLITPAASSGKRTVTVWQSVRPSVCRAGRHTQRDSPGDSMRRS